jgi:hypothetical protein
MRSRLMAVWCGLAALASLACAPTASTGSLPVEVLVVLDSTTRTLTLIPVDSTRVITTLPIDIPDAAPTSLAVRGSLAIVGLAGPDPLAALVFDLSTRSLERLVAFSPGTVASVAFGDDGIGYAAIPDAGRVLRFDPTGTGLQDLAVAGGPQAFGVMRGRVFALNGNRVGCAPGACAGFASWLTTVTNGARDSIPLVGPGNAASAAAGPDGFLYVLNTGDGAPVEGRLSVVDPVRGTETASFGGFGPAPRFVASDGGSRVLVASATGGLMAFDIRERRVERGFGLGIPLGAPSGLAADALGRAYVLERGSCTPQAPGRVRVFGADLIERPALTGGICPIGVGIAEIPAELLGIAP